MGRLRLEDYVAGAQLRERIVKHVSPGLDGVESGDGVFSWSTLREDGGPVVEMESW